MLLVLMHPLNYPNQFAYLWFGLVHALFDLFAGNRYNRPLMFADLPERVEPLQLAEQGVTLEGSLPLTSLDRLRDSAPPGGLVRVRLRFASEHGAHPTMSGDFETALTRVCQRCLEPMELPVSGEFEVALVRDLDAADTLADRYDILQVDGRPMTLKTIIEDEVLLAVPAVALHPAGVCEAAESAEESVEAQPLVSDRPNPFAVLAALKQNHDPE